MSNNSNDHTMNRRHFMRQAACAALGATAMVNTLASLKLTSAAMAQGAVQDDYKALVCIFMAGGNDSNNLLVPRGSNPLRTDYDDGRGVIAIPSDQLHALTVPTTTMAFDEYHGGTKSPMGIHPDAKGIADLFNNKDLSFVCNVGTLAYPIQNRNQYINKSVPLPADLFSHSNQQMEWQTSVADKPSATGWGGRTADLLHAGHNGDTSKVSMSISLAGANTFQRGLSAETAAFAIGSTGAKPLVGYGPSDAPYDRAYHEGSTYAEPNYKDTRAGHRLKALETLIKLTSNNLLEDAHMQKVVSSRAVSDTVNDALAAATDIATDIGTNFDQLFVNAQHTLGDQLKTVAQLIAGRTVLGNQRQIFFVQVGGYDVHQSHLTSHADLMTELSTGLMAFSEALKATGNWDKTLAYTASDFSRTFTPNGDDAEAGTDHAWGGHAMVMGGSVAGGELYGSFPSLKTGAASGSIDAHTGRGRWIPSTSVDQYSSVMAKWFGVDSNSMETIFPNLGRFDDPVSTTLANLRFIEGM